MLVLLKIIKSFCRAIIDASIENDAAQKNSADNKNVLLVDKAGQPAIKNHVYEINLNPWD